MKTFKAALLVLLLSTFVNAQRSLQYVDLTWDQFNASEVSGFVIEFDGQTVNVNKGEATAIDDTTFSYRLFYPGGGNFVFDFQYSFRLYSVNMSGEVSEGYSRYDRSFILADVNDDQELDGLDGNQLLLNFGKTGLGYRDFYDLNADGEVDGLDRNLYLLEWNKKYLNNQ